MKLPLTLCLFLFSTACLWAQSAPTQAEPTQSVVLSEEAESPVILFDKREITQGELAAMDQSKIGDIQILTGEEAKNRFGKYGKLGAIVISSAAPSVSSQVEAPMSVPASAPSEQVTVANSDEVKMSFGSDLNAYVVIDGKPSTMEILQGLKPEQIKSMDVIKGDAAIVKYGEIAKEGAVEVTTKQ